MKTTLNNNTLTLYLDKRIDSVNAAELDREMAAAVEVAADADVVLDAGELEYISSAGLRILMKLRKRLNKPLPVVNVSPEVYDIFEVTGFTELLDVRKRLRQVSIEGCQELGSGANGTVYRLTRDEMIKVFGPGYTLTEIEHEREASRKAFLLGVGVADYRDLAATSIAVADGKATIGTNQPDLRKANGRVYVLVGATPDAFKAGRATKAPASVGKTPSELVDIDAASDAKFFRVAVGYSAP